MNNVTPEKKSGVLNTLAIIGLIGLIILIALLSVQLVKVFPNAMTSLVGMADDVYNLPVKNDESNNNFAINLTSTDIETTVSGKGLTLTWDNEATRGYYTFKYECVDGLSLTIKTEVSEFAGASCDNRYNIGLVDSATLLIESEKNASVDFNYSLSYYKENSFGETSSISKSIKVVNPSLAVINNPVVPVTPVEPEPVPVATSTPPTTPTPTTPPTTPTPVYTYTYAIPVSNPNGFTDLSVTYLGIGVINRNNIFVPQSTLNRNAEGSFQFSVKNIGSKTSNDWTFESDLPGGLSYTSGKQLPLKPNERAIITLGFPEIDSRGVKAFGAEVNITGDSNRNNNKFSWSVIVN